VAVTAFATRLARFAGRAVTRMRADLALQLDDVEEDVGLGGAISSATIGGCVEMVDTTVTRTPCAGSPRPASGKSPSPENSTI